MKFALRLFLVLGVALAAVAALPAAKQLYTCGWHPQIVRDQPGNCPICGMKLLPVRASTVASAGDPKGAGERKIKYYKSTMIPGEVKPGPGKDSMGMDMVPVYEGEDTSAENNIQIDAATVQRMNLRTALVQRGPVKREFRTVGTVAYDEQGLRDITTKYEGWLEKLYVNATWTSVKAGEPLFEIYSPDLYNAQLNYLVALQSEGTAAGPLTRAALARLQLFDVPADVIAELGRTKTAQRTFTYRAPADGVVIEKMAVEGQMMKAGERIYRLADLSKVWILAQIYEKDLPYVHSGQTAIVRASYGQDRTFEGTVQLVLPRVEDVTRTATARIVLPNPDGFLRPGMFVDVRFAAQLADDAVLVPEEAILRSGEHNTVFVALDGGFFDPREVKLGVRSEGGFYQVLSGVRAGERIVTSGQFMLDSESQLREAIQKMLKSTEGTPGQPAAAPAEQGSAADRSATGGQRKIKYYKSTMMPGETSPTPAKDSMGMDMVPVYEDPAPAHAPASNPPQGDPPQPAGTTTGVIPASLKPFALASADAAAADRTAMLPPGHPRLDRAALAAFSRRRPAAGEAGAAGAARSGMSAAAMTAGASCDLAKG